MPLYDRGARRRAVRKGRERGCWVYIPAEELDLVDRLDPEVVPLYRLWPSRSGAFTIRLYWPEKRDEKAAA